MWYWLVGILVWFATGAFTVLVERHHYHIRDDLRGRPRTPFGRDRLIGFMVFGPIVFVFLFLTGRFIDYLDDRKQHRFYTKHALR